MKKRVAQAATSAIIIFAATLGLSGEAFASGTVTWTNAQTGYCLTTKLNQWQSPVLSINGCGTWLNPQNDKYWYDTNKGNNAWEERNTTYSAVCLDGNYGQAYVGGCNGSNWQMWYEDSTSTGWRLTSVHTGYVLDANEAGAYTNPDYGDGDLYQRWH